MKIIAVIVTYQPDIQKLAELLDSLLPQVSICVLVDNGSSAATRDHLQRTCSGQIEFIFLASNTGIAAAQNIGIARAREMAGDYVLLSDQDSVPGRSMVATLAAAIENQQNEGIKVACAGPRYIDMRQENPPPFIRVRGLRLERCSCQTEETVVPVDYLIASGCLIPMPVLDRIGGMREDLFIDYVDIEWGLRARKSGYQSIGVCAAGMAHSLGDSPIALFGRKFPMHSPLRHYYHFRNAILLYKESWVPLNWKCVDGWRLCLKYVFYSLFAQPRPAHWKMMTLGIWHGLGGKAGKYDKE